MSESDLRGRRTKAELVGGHFVGCRDHDLGLAVEDFSNRAGNGICFWARCRRGRLLRGVGGLLRDQCKRSECQSKDCQDGSFHFVAPCENSRQKHTTPKPWSLAPAP